jgi:hypothetical protein
MTKKQEMWQISFWLTKIIVWLQVLLKFVGNGVQISYVQILQVLRQREAKSIELNYTNLFYIKDSFISTSRSILDSFGKYDNDASSYNFNL